MNTDTLYIRTRSGQQYHVTPEGYIKRLDIAGFVPSKNWIMRGLHHVNQNKFIPIETIRDIPPNSDLLYKNGKPQWCIADTDHGTWRIMGDVVVAISPLR